MFPSAFYNCFLRTREGSGHHLHGVRLEANRDGEGGRFRERRVGRGREKRGREDRTEDEGQRGEVEGERGGIRRQQVLLDAPSNKDLPDLPA